MHSFPLTVPPDVAFASIQFLCFRYFFFILTSQHSVLLTAPENRRNKTGCIKTMPGPKMGPRPNDFDEDLVRQAPTFQRWQKMLVGQKLRYACRDFVKGHGDDEERLMRRIMIARRNNLRDHAILKRARAQTGTPIKEKSSDEESLPKPPPPKKKRVISYALTDDEVMREMDVSSVERTRSFKSWAALEEGQTFTYNQTYVKGKEGHDWLLKKNIWRRMRYRRENKKMVEKLKGPEGSDSEDEIECPDKYVDHVDHGFMSHEDDSFSAVAATAASVATHIVDQSLPPILAGTDISCSDIPVNLLRGADVTTLSDSAHGDNMHDDVVEAAVAAAENYVKQARESDTADFVAQSLDHNADANSLSVHNPIMSVPTTVDTDSIADMADHHHTPNPLVGFDGDALDVAAKLAAAASANAGTESGNEYEV